MTDKTKALLDRAPEIVAAVLCDKTMESCGKAKQCPYHSTDYNHISVGYGCDVDRLDADTAGLLKAYAAENAQLREQLDEALMGHMATEANDPLTLEDLRGMDGEPVWIKNLGGTDVRDSGWAGIAFEMFYGTYVYWLWNDFEDNPKNENYGKTWIAYRRPPEGGEGR